MGGTGTILEEKSLLQFQIETGESSALRAFRLHPSIHEGLGAARAAQMLDVGAVRERVIPACDAQRFLLRSVGRRGVIRPGQPPVLCITPRTVANVTVIGLCPRHTRHPLQKTRAPDEGLLEGNLAQ